MSITKIPIVCVCGFLGSGKTTLLRNWRRDKTLRAAPLIVHDLSEFGLDARTLADEGSQPVPGRLVDGIAALHGKHAREKLFESIGITLKDIIKVAPQASLVLCESTGAALPWSLIKALTQDNRFYLRHFIVTVDALSLHRDFADGKLLLNDLSQIQDIGIRKASEVLKEQVLFSNVILLTKIDTVPQEALDVQIKALKEICPNVTIGLSAHAGIQLTQLDSTLAPEISFLEKQADSLGLNKQGAPTANSFDAIVFRDPRPFHPNRLYQLCCNNLTTGLYRTKGFIWLASRPGQALMWQQSGSQIDLEFIGYWRAEIAQNRDGKLSEEEVQGLRAQLMSKDPIFGDRYNELTLIGMRNGRELFFTGLKEALCTDEEIAAWENGEEFDDPWPQTFRQT